MLLRKFLFLTLLLLLLAFSSVVQAQLGESPLVILMQGDLHAWDNGQLFRMTNNGYNSGLSMSPQGRFVAYSAISPVGTRVLESGFVGDAQFPTDIFIYDLQTNGITPAALQPTDVRFMSDSGSDNFVTRSRPAWSADGTLLAWSEMVFPGFAHRLIRYDTRTGTTTMLSVLPEPGGIPAPAPVLWVGSNIVAHLYVINESEGNFQDTFLTFDVNGRQVGDVQLATSPDDTLLDVVPVAQGGATAADRVALHFAGGTWELLDPISGTQQPMTEPPELYSLSKPGVSATLRATANFDSQLGITYAWDLVSASRQNVQRLPFSGPPERITIAPDGVSVAFVAEDAAYLWLGQAQRIEGTQVVADDFNAVVAWGPTGWRTPAFTASVVAPTQSSASVNDGSGVICQGFIASRLVIGQQGRVTTTSDIPNNVRSGAGVNNQQIGQIPAGGLFEVLSGPMCVGDTAWWQVRYRDLTGWTAEGAGSDYWLEPVAPISTNPDSSTAQTYTVQRGDILARIAQQFNVTVDCILQLNDIPNPNRINAGQVLVIDPAACG